MSHDCIGKCKMLSSTIAFTQKCGWQTATLRFSFLKDDSLWGRLMRCGLMTLCNINYQRRTIEKYTKRRKLSISAFILYTGLQVSDRNTSHQGAREQWAIISKVMQSVLRMIFINNYQTGSIKVTQFRQSSAPAISWQVVM